MKTKNKLRMKLNLSENIGHTVVPEKRLHGSRQQSAL
jgi:hypothetical protein